MRAAKCPARSTPREDAIAAAIGTWAVVGLMLDGRAHETGAVESFFTPWHAVLYSGVAMALAALAVMAARGRMRGGRAVNVLPAGYGLALAGAAVMALAGLGDMVWHAAFGIEEDLAALLSPTHLMLLGGGLLLLTAPLRSAWRRAPAATTSWRQLGAAVVSTTLAAATVGFFVEFASPFHDPGPFSGGGPHGGPELGVAGMLIDTAIFGGALGLLVRRFGPLSPGMALVLLVGFAALLSLASDFRVAGSVAAAAVAGAFAEVLMILVTRRLRPATGLRLLLAAAPVPLWLSFFAVLAVRNQFSWEPELWTGSTVLASLTGYGIGLLLTIGRSAAEARPAGAGAAVA
jgi:hypothetical protein